MSDSKTLVECRICGERYKTLHPHLKKHGMDSEMYLELYPDCETMSESYRGRLKILMSIGRETLKTMKPAYRSKSEKEIADCLTEAGFDVISPYRKLGFELDIFIPSKNVAIEYNGLRYHSEIYGGKGRRYHSDKTKACNDSGIRLIHIFDDEYLSNKRLVLSKIMHVLGASFGKKVYARKCHIKEIDSKEAKTFFDRNHIQKYSGSSVAYGLFHDGELVSSMAFKKYQNKNIGFKENYYELIRFATRIDVIGIGMAGKLLSHFWKSVRPEGLVTFADLRWSSHEANMYTMLGFRQDAILPPDYMYVGKSYHKREHKYLYDKKKLSIKFPNEYDPAMTEWENMKALGYDRVWDVGKIRYVMESEAKHKPCNTAESGDRRSHAFHASTNNIGVDRRRLTDMQIEEAKAFKTKTELRSEKNADNPYSNMSCNGDWSWDSVKPYRSNKLQLDMEAMERIAKMYLSDDRSLTEIGNEMGFSRQTVKSILLSMGITINTSKKQWKGGRSASDSRYREANKEAVKAKMDAYAERNREERKDYMKEYYERNKEYRKMSLRKRRIGRNE